MSFWQQGEGWLFVVLGLQSVISYKVHGVDFVSLRLSTSSFWEFQASSKFPQFLFLLIFHKEGFCCEPRTTGIIASQRTGLKLQAYVTLSASVWEGRIHFGGKFLNSNSQQSIGEEIRTVNHREHSDSQLEMHIGDNVLVLHKILFPKDRLALWFKFSYLLVFREDRLRAFFASLPSTFC